jgi:thymidylate synthase
VRVYSTFKEAKNEIARDLNELGREVFAGYQSKDLSTLPASMKTKELTDYDYIVLKPDFGDLNPTQPWADREWRERLAGILGRPLNPGHAWEARKDVWEPLLEQRADDPQREENRAFSYTYSERLALANVPNAVEAFEANVFSRQVWIPIWNPIDNDRLGKRRVPCTLGYQLTVRRGEMNIAYHMRSSDFSTHFDNDIWLAMQLQKYIADEIAVPVGTFTHKLGSLHVYAADVAHVF